jgi:hypothetical protein
MENLKEELNALFILVRELEERQKKGDFITTGEVKKVKSLTLTLESIAESMVPEDNN